MIIWINGPFGVGKTTVSKLVATRLGGVVVDPEHVGLLVRMTLGSEHDDYQDSPVWRETVRSFVASINRHADCPVVVPMTLRHRPYFDEIVGGLRDDEDQLLHVTLTAERATLVRRIDESDDELARDWRIANLDTSTALSDVTFAEHIATDGLTPDQVATEVVGRANSLRSA